MSEKDEIFERARAGDHDGVHARLASLAAGTARQYGEALVSGFVDGTLGAPASGFAALWDRLAEEGWAPFERVRDAQDAAAIARWVWSPRWSLLEQDEDLMLFGRAEALLDAIAVGEPPKRAYALGIVAHDVRDGAWGAICGKSPAPWERADALARRAGPGELAGYLTRIASYGRVQRVDEEGARARAIDVHRCAPPPSYTLERRGQAWAIAYPSGARLTIGRHDGVMRGTHRA